MMPDLCVRNKQTKASKDKTEPARVAMNETKLNQKPNNVARQLCEIKQKKYHIG